jgi:hypothetical protein
MPVWLTEYEKRTWGHPMNRQLGGEQTLPQQLDLHLHLGLDLQLHLGLGLHLHQGLAGAGADVEGYRQRGRC